MNIDVSGLPAETENITLKVNWVDRMRGGLSWPGTNIVAICTKAWWNDSSSNEQNDVIVHEIGHKLGMVADGSGKLPAKPANFYDKSGHKSNHCHSGVSQKVDYSNDASAFNCVMFGATNGHSDFCADCAKAVKKWIYQTAYD